MWRPVTIATAAVGEPISAQRAKAHLAVEHNDDDELIGELVAVARAHVEAVTGTRLYTQTVRLKTDCWADLALGLPVAPIQSVTSVAYVDVTGAPATLSSAVYEDRLDGLEPVIVLKSGQSYPTREPGSLITITAVAGYGAENAQPPDVAHALKLTLGDLYRYRETLAPAGVARIPSAASVEALLANHKLHLI
jgi:uncharacterized phiE125 gp8 family phage protein